jgi:DNA-binding NtrC family response regulator
MNTRWEALILSNDLDLRRVLGRLLAANHMDFSYASSIETCKEIVARECVGLIFWDSHTWDGTYRDLARSMRSLDPRVKIVVISHSDDWNEHLSTTQMGAFGIIPFPCEPTDVEWVLSRAVRAELQEAKLQHVREVQLHL